VKVIELAHIMAGPVCGLMLADMGADVIKIEAPHKPDMMRVEGHGATPEMAGRGPEFISQNGNKRSLSLDLGTPDGLAVARKLTETADVIVENYRRGVIDGYGLGYEAAAEIRPDIVYCSLTGFGHTGPKAAHPAFDPVIQAFSGLMAANGTPDTHPVRVGPALIDYGTGAQAAFAIASALFQRSRTGRGQRIDVAMLDAALMMMSTHVVNSQLMERTPPPMGNTNPQRAAYSCYETADGLIFLGAFTLKQAQTLWRALGRNDIADELEGRDLAFMFSRADAHAPILRDIMKTRPAQDWEDLINEAGVPAARVRRVDEALHEAQVASRGVLRDNEGVPGGGQRFKAPAAAFGYMHGGPELHSPAPKLGEHTAAILEEIGYGADRIAKLGEDGVIFAS
ncbi:MAG: CoA transferase, partial [Alphaproteobacteria bacterium]|nr:CoA transferase [Alphaproteobacteria bacterium]